MRGDELTVCACRAVRTSYEKGDACGERHSRKRSTSLPSLKALSPEVSGSWPDRGFRPIFRRYGGHNPASKPGWRPEAKRLILQKRFVADNLAIGGSAAAAAAQVLLHGKRVGGVQFAIREAVQKKLALRARCDEVHGSVSFDALRSEPFQAAANILRARARRDITVPMGTPVISAISR